MQSSSTNYAALLFGAITKTCTFTGGAFLSDTFGARVRADIDGSTNKWKQSSSGSDAARAFSSSITRSLDSYSPIAFNGVTPLYPVTVEVGRATPSGFNSVMGYAPGVRLLKMAGQYDNKDIVTLGGNDWMVFSLFGGGFAFLK